MVLLTVPVGLVATNESMQVKGLAVLIAVTKLVKSSLIKKKN